MKPNILRTINLSITQHISSTAPNHCAFWNIIGGINRTKAPLFNKLKWVMQTWCRFSFACCDVTADGQVDCGDPITFPLKPSSSQTFDFADSRSLDVIYRLPSNFYTCSGRNEPYQLWHQHHLSFSSTLWPKPQHWSPPIYWADCHGNSVHILTLTLLTD